MKKQDSRKNVMYRVTFSASESEMLQQQAEEIGVSVCGYIKQMALTGKVMNVDWDALRHHSDLVSTAVMWLDLMVANARQNETVSEADLILLSHEIENLIALERELYHWLGLELKI